VLPFSYEQPTGEAPSAQTSHRPISIADDLLGGTTEATAYAINTNRKLAMMVIGTLGGEEIAIGLDSLSQGSFIDQAIVDMYPHLFPPIKPLSFPLYTTSAHQTTVPATGYMDLTFQMGNTDYTHKMVVVPNFGKLFILGIDFLEQNRWTKPDHETYVIFNGVNKVEYIPHPLVFETDSLRLVLVRERKIQPGDKCYMVAYLQGTSERDLGDVAIGELGLARQDANGTSQLQGLMMHEGFAKVEKGLKVVIIMENKSDHPVTIPRNTNIGIYSKNTADVYFMHHNEVPDSVPDADLIKAVKSWELTPERTETILNIVFNRRAVFSMHPRKPGLNRLVEHVIDTGSHPPIRCKPHFTTYQEEQLLRKEILDMLEKGICRPSNSPWAFPILMVRKPGGEIRPVFDARKLNDITKRDSYTLPRVQDLLQQFAGAEFFSVGDASSGFWQVPLSEDSIPKCAFITRFGLYEFLVLPFGLVNSPATFQRLMDMVLGNMRWDRASIYVDDVIVYSPSWDQHIVDLDEFLKRCIECGISLKLSKCRFGQTEVKYLGHRITKEGHTMDQSKLQAILDTPPPANMEQLRSLLGLFGHYRQYIHHFADIAEPLQSMARQVRDEYHLKKGKPRKKSRKRFINMPAKPFQWGDAEQKAFDTLKQKLTEAPILAHPDFSGQYDFTLETDASTIGAGAVLTQALPDGNKVIGYYSYTFKPNERKWSTTERETYAALLGMRAFRHLVSGFHFTLVTDHQALRYIKSMKDPHGRIARWLMEMQMYDYDINHKPGKLHVVPDALSRAPIVQAVQGNDQDTDSASVFITSTVNASMSSPSTHVNTDIHSDVSFSPYPPKRTSVSFNMMILSCKHTSLTSRVALSRAFLKKFNLSSSTWITMSSSMMCCIIYGLSSRLVVVMR